MQRDEYIDLFYYIGKIVLVLMIAVAIFMKTDFGYRFFMEGGGCAFEKATGIICPGCGGTRAAYALLNFKFIQAFIYHPALVYAIIAYSVFMVKCFINKHFGLFYMKYNRLMLAIYTGIALIIVQWIVKVVLAQCGFDILAG